MNNDKGYRGKSAHHHSQHTKSEYLDEAELFKRSSMSMQRKRKIISKVLFALLSVIAVLVVIACVLVNI